MAVELGLVISSGKDDRKFKNYHYRNQSKLSVLTAILTCL
jgi:hypothetical protein